MQQPSIAVVVPILNEAERLPGIFELLGELGAEEVVLVDGGSTDASQEMLSQCSFTWCQSETGRAVQMNCGASQCHSDILLFIHADTDMNSSHLSAIRKAMDNSLTVGGRFDIHLSGNHPAFRVIEWFINLRSRITGINTGDQCQFVRREIFESMGGFPEQPLMEDVEFSKRLKRMGRIACLRNWVTTSSRRWEKYGILRTILLMWKLRLLYWLGVSSDRLAGIYANVR